jgi:hypothetical protein
MVVVVVIDRDEDTERRPGALDHDRRPGLVDPQSASGAPDPKAQPEQDDRTE